MKAWKHQQTGQLHDIQTSPGPLPSAYNPNDWDLVDVTQADIKAYWQSSTEVQEVRRTLLLERLDRDWHAYLIVRGYAQPAREGMQAIYTNIMDTENPTQAQRDAKALIRQAWDFVDRGMTYLFQKSQELNQATDVDAVTWDFHSLDALDPQVSLQTIKLMLL